MKKFISQRGLQIPVKIGGVWRTLRFQEAKGDYIYTSSCEEECEELLKHPYCVNGDIKVVDENIETPVVRGGMNIPVNQKRYAKADADKKKREIVDGIGSCSDARAYLRERFKDESAILRSKKEILEYAEARNIFFTDLL